MYSQDLSTICYFWKAFLRCGTETIILLLCCIMFCFTSVHLQKAGKTDSLCKMAASEKPMLERCGSTCTKRMFCDLRWSKWPSLIVWMTEPPHPLRMRAPCFCEWDPPQESWPREPCYRASPKSGLMFLSWRGCNYGDGHCHLFPKSSQLRFIVSILPLHIIFHYRKYYFIFKLS